ncbi:MAG: hypothetical protein JWQ23_3430 [Herminiimonas sp.]|nr:hypothetical protein [Herminiimonas sp.]
MASTLIGVYDHYSDAESALSALRAHGFPYHDMMLALAEETPLGRRAALRKLDQANDLSESSTGLQDFFRTFFASDTESDDRDIYFEAVRRGSYLMIVNAANDQLRDEALEIMLRHHPVNIDERAAQWRHRGWSKYDTSAPFLTDPEIGHERSLYAEGRSSLSVHGMQGDPKSTGGPALEDLTSVPGATEVPRPSVRIFQRGFQM